MLQKPRICRGFLRHQHSLPEKVKDLVKLQIPGSHRPSPCSSLCLLKICARRLRDWKIKDFFLHWHHPLIQKPSITGKRPSTHNLLPLPPKKLNCKKDECVICRAPCRTIVLSKKMNPDIQALFMGIDGLCRKYSKEVTQIVQFQEKHRQQLLAHYRGKITKLEGYLKRATQQIQQMQQLQQVSSVEVDYVPSSVRKAETVGGPTRISLISPPQDGHMGSVSCRSSQLSGKNSCQKSSSGSIRSSPLRIPANRTSYMSQFVSSQDNRSHVPDAFGPRTTQHYLCTPSLLPAMAKHSINLGSLLQRQHLGSGILPGHSLQK
ncbi:probable E3 SUMO-protein ligase RNF212 isoform X2 [Sceloporus undulatus]|uniref:probable E3 SUMO-protein ligase RNF212 isoform X2 n=1 Tax=Sceloporus undulatus TaxID=8520 RepID=UPI001C4C4A33|nr:probable E3 SUMO-protein ligase RNF212 isoform X2 [Sceloporus undulatus]